MSETQSWSDKFRPVTELCATGDKHLMIMPGTEFGDAGFWEDAIMEWRAYAEANGIDWREIPLSDLELVPVEVEIPAYEQPTLGIGE